MPEVDLLTTIILVILSPLGYYMLNKKFDQDFLINLILWILTFSILGAMHAFYTMKMDILKIILNYLLPPLSIYLATKDVKATIINIVLCLFFWLPGIIHAFYVTVNDKKEEPLIK